MNTTFACTASLSTGNAESTQGGGPGAGLCYLPLVSARTVIVGDVHGCRLELEDLLGEIGFAGGDTLIGAGDLLGKGPDGAGVVRLFREGGHTSVLGNHDAKVLAWRRGERSLKGSHREHADGMTDADWAWLEGLPLWLRLPEHGAIVVHGGIVPGRPVESHDPSVLMNLRSLTPEGLPSKMVEDGVPWASCWRGPEIVVFGHDALRGLQVYEKAIGLDTGCVYGGELTALVLPEARIVSVPAREAYTPLEA